MNTLKIIDGGRVHLEGILTIERASFPDPWTAGQLEEKLLAPDALFLVAELEARVLGYGIVQRIAGEGELYNFAVAPEVRGRGVGTRLLEKLLRRGASAELSQIHLEVRAGNSAARRLYAAAGFLPVGVRKAYYRRPREDAVLMTYTYCDGGKKDDHSGN